MNTIGSFKIQSSDAGRDIPPVKSGKHAFACSEENANRSNN